MQRKFYKDLYDLEDKHWWHKNKRSVVLKLINQFVAVKEKKLRILDIGCGTGKNLEDMRGLGSAVGIDISKEAIKFCRKRGLKNVAVGSSYETNFKKSSFQVSTLLDVLEHTDDKKTLEELHRVLKPDGFLVITVPAFKFLWSKWDDVLKHKRRYTKSSLRQVLENNGFTVLKISYMYSFLVLPALVIRLIKSKQYKNNYPSDFQLSNPLLNSFFLGLAKLEYFFSAVLPIPFGTSLVCISKKKGFKL